MNQEERLKDVTHLAAAEAGTADSSEVVVGRCIRSLAAEAVSAGTRCCIVVVAEEHRSRCKVVEETEFGKALGC